MNCIDKKNNIEEQINNLDSIDNWNDKIESIKEIKENIKEEEKNIDELLLQLDNPSKKKINIDVDLIIQKINESTDIEKKIKYYHKLSFFIENLEQELFG
jgi:hypothetical protein